jgi:thiol-disulfide isomerase/thioredoxin
MSMLRLSLVLFFALLSAVPAAAEEAPSGPALFLRDGTVKPCLEAPVLAFGRAVYTSLDGVRHSTSLDLVDVEKTRAHARGRVADRELGPAPTAEAVAGRKVAVDFALERPDGATLMLSDLRGKVVLIDFWATWCRPCVRAMPEVLALEKDYQDRDFQIVGVSLDSNRKSFEDFQRNKGMSFPQYFDGKKWNTVVAKKYGVGSIPRTVLLDRQGNIAHQNLRGAGLRAAIDRLLAEGSAPATQPAAGE